MKNLLWLVAVIAALYLMKDHFPFGRPPEIKPLTGRWDRVGSGDYIRFADNGWFRSYIDKRKEEGKFQLLPGGAIEFSTSYQLFDPLTRKLQGGQNVRECKCFLEDNKLFLDTYGHWVEFEKAKDAGQSDEKR